MRQNLFDRMKKVILLDIDRTIFDTSKLTESLISGISEIIGDVGLKKLREAKDNFIASLSADREFDPEKFTKFLCDKFNFERQDLLLDVFYSERNRHWYKDFVFPETFIVLKRLTNKYRLGVFSEGTKKFQNYKYNSMGISGLLDKELIFILGYKTNLEALAKIPSDSVVVDDKESVCEYLSNNGIKTIWLNKKDDRISDKFQTIHNLLELPDKLM